jgi:hypothetical protein
LSPRLGHELEMLPRQFVEYLFVFILILEYEASKPLGPKFAIGNDSVRIPYFCKSHLNVILSFPVGLTSGRFPKVFFIKILCEFLSSPSEPSYRPGSSWCATCQYLNNSLLGGLSTPMPLNSLLCNILTLFLFAQSLVLGYVYKDSNIKRPLFTTIQNNWLIIRDGSSVLIFITTDDLLHSL